MTLFSRVLGDPAHPRLIIAHGLCGSGRNWLSAGESLSQANFCVELLDLRDHGKSPWTDRLDYDILSQDFLSHWRASGSPAFILLGHSLGGKLAMTLATQHLAAFGKKLRGLCVIDIAPKPYAPHYQPALRACLDLDLARITSRAEADAALRPTIPNDRFRAFLLTNLIKAEAPSLPASPIFRWSCNFSLILHELPKLAANPLSPTDRCDLPALFLAGSQSDFVTPTDEPLLKTHFPSAALSFLPSGHNLHIESPTEFIQQVSAWAKNLP